MKRLLFLFAFLPCMTQAQTTQKVLHMTATRTVGNKLDAALYNDASFNGPVLDFTSKKCFMNNTSFAFTRLKEIRFSIVEEEVTSIAATTLEDAKAEEQTIYDLQGRKMDAKRLSDENLRAGIYIIGNKKYLKK